MARSASLPPAPVSGTLTCVLPALVTGTLREKARIVLLPFTLEAVAMLIAFADAFGRPHERALPDGSIQAGCGSRSGSHRRRSSGSRRSVPGARTCIRHKRGIL